MPKLPAIQFYPGDWRKDVGVQSLTFHDRGVWFEILMLMHESERRGVLTLNGSKMPESALARLLGLDKQILTTTLSELLTSGVASLDPDTGALMCRRMVRDEHIRNVRVAAGKLGGNPNLVNQKATTGDNQKPTPSVSSSTSASKIKTNTASRAFALPAWIDTHAWNGYEEMRKKERHPLTDRARSLAISELEKLKASGSDPTAVLNQSTLKGWRGLFPVNGTNGGINGTNRTNQHETRNDRILREALASLDSEEAESAGRGHSGPASVC